MNEEELLRFVRGNGHLTVEQFAEVHGLKEWCALFARGYVMVLHNTICLTFLGERRLRAVAA